LAGGEGAQQPRGDRRNACSFLETPWVETARRQLETTALSLEEVAVGSVAGDL